MKKNGGGEEGTIATTIDKLLNQKVKKYCN